MGLDMYLEGEEYIPHDQRGTEKPPMRGRVFELGYWRKHPNLHGFIVQTFGGGRDECQRIELTVKDLKTILAASEADQLPETTGFFFGESQPEDKPETKEVLERAIEWLETETPGEVFRSVYYQASW